MTEGRNSHAEDFVECEVYYTGLDGVGTARDDETAAQLARVLHCTLVLKNGHIVTSAAFARGLNDLNLEAGRVSARARALEQVDALLFFKGRG